MNMKQRWGVLVATGALALGLAGCGASGGATGNSAATTPAPAPAVAKPIRANLYLNVLTGKQDGKPGWPMFAPADFTVPANALVTVQVRVWDDGTAPLAANSPYAKVTGTVGGTATVVSNATPNASPSTITSLNPNAVSHTFTVTGLKLNVPLPVSSTVTFTFKTPAKPGTFTWACLAPCGSGANGMGGAMVTDGYMTGKMTVQ